MNIQIKATTLSLTPAISEYVEKKLSALSKFFDNDTTVRCDVELAKTTNHHNKGDIFKAEVHIVAKDKNIYASVEKEDLYVAIDLVKDDVVREITTTNERQRSQLRKGEAKIKEIIKGSDKE
jgi:putative sigma-54 modulation protein